MSNFFSKLDKAYNWLNDEVYKYLLFLYYLNKITKPLYAFFLGFLAALALPPLNFVFLLPFAFASVIRMTDFCETKWQAYKVGFYFSFGFCLTGFYWVSFAVLNEKSFLWLLPFAFFGVPLLLALLQAFLFPIYLHIVTYCSAIKKLVIFSALWVFFEILRGFVVFQFPWNFLGYSFSFSDGILQITSVIGVLGLSFITILWASSFHLLMLTGDKDDFVKYFKFLLFNNIFLFLLFLFGSINLMSNKNTNYEDITLRIVQGNVKAGGGNAGSFDPHLEKYLRLTTSKSLENVDYIIWPEGSINSFAYNNEDVKNRLSSILTGEQILITGSVRFEKTAEDYDVFNSIIFINKTGGATFYDKNYLVPFGEFVPFKSLIPLKAIANSWKDFSRGEGMQTLKLSSKVPPFMPLICYEIAFTGQVGNYDNLEPEWILNITNDAWYGYSSGPFQHLQISRIRGIEEGMPVIRASNNGISAVFDEYGRTISRTSLFKEQVIDVKLPQHKKSRTVFSFLGNYPLITGLILFLLFSFSEFYYIKNDKKINEAGYKMASKKLPNKKKY
jgi:apolipoprotein N-acyltransferase